MKGQSLFSAKNFKETICIEYQSLFSGGKKIVKLSSAEFAKSVVTLGKNFSR